MGFMSSLVWRASAFWQLRPWRGWDQVGINHQHQDRFDLIQTQSGSFQNGRVPTLASSLMFTTATGSCRGIQDFLDILTSHILSVNDLAV